MLALVEEGELVRSGKARAVRYRRSAETPVLNTVNDAEQQSLPISDESKATQDYVRRPIQGREPVGYQRAFLESYIPNHTCYLPDRVRQDLYSIGEIRPTALPAGSTVPAGNGQQVAGRPVLGIQPSGRQYLLAN